MLERRIEKLEDRTTDKGLQCFLTVEYVRGPDRGKFKLKGIPTCPRGKTLSEDLRECSICEVREENRRHLHVKLEGSESDVAELQKVAGFGQKEER